MFLVGKSIPEHIKSLPQTVLDTPFGQMLRPQLDQSLRSLTQAPQASTDISTQDTNSIGSTQKRDNYLQGVVHKVSSLQEISRLTSWAADRCVIIFFTSSTCPPCKLMYPVFDELAEVHPQVTFIKVDINYASDIASRYNIRATPTFMAFLKQKKFDEWRGANEHKLRSNTALLVQAAFPPHPHSSLFLPVLLPRSLQMVTYASIPPFDKIMAKIEPIAVTETSVKSMRQLLENRAMALESQEQPLPDLSSFCQFLTKALSDIKVENMFAVYDILRAASTDQRVSAFFISGRGSDHLVKLFKYVNTLEKCPYSLKLIALQLGCNLTSHKQTQKRILEFSDLLSELVSFVSPCLRGLEKDTVHISAASLAFNLGVANHRIRSQERHEGIPEEKQVELGAALLEGIALAENRGFLTGLLRALGLLIYCAPLDGELFDLCRALGAISAISEKTELLTDNAIATEVGKLLRFERPQS